MARFLLLMRGGGEGYESFTPEQAEALVKYTRSFKK